ncbi:uncharacterized protein [Bemisia tabaci]|uniref:uncharacterized protein n=1 Tax=Bemisia tabaci TaxID=7038 RepID=UPI003B27B631
MAENVKTLRRQRGKVQASITTFTKKLDNWRDDVENRDPDLLQQNLVSLQKRFESFDAIQDQLEELDSQEIKQGESIQDSFDEVVARATRYLREALHQTEVGSVISNHSLPHSSAGGSGQFSSRSSSYGIRLPKLNLPKFKGEISTWQNFYNLFIVSIHESPLKDVEKFQYLLSTLDGEAKDLVKGLAITEANYTVAWELLCSRYNCKRRHIFHHFNRFLELSELKHSSQLSSFITKIREHTQALKALGYDIEQYDAFLVAVLYRKFSPYYRRRLDDYRGSDTDYPDVDILVKFLDKECLAVDDTSPAEHEKKEPRIKALVTSNSNPKSAPTPGGQGGKSTQGARKCISCNGELHPLYTCPSFRNLKITERRDLVGRAGFCFNCLGQNHKKQDCKSDSRCRHCSGPHHSLTCMTTKNLGTKADPPTGREGPGPSSDHGPVALASVADAPDVHPSVLLGTALIDVQGGDGRFHTLRAVIDSAATTSFLTKSAAQKLKLKYERLTEQVSGIGGGHTSDAVKGRATCLIKPRGKDEPVLSTETTIIKKIVGNLPYLNLSQNVNSHFSQLMLADPGFAVKQEIEFLVGADVFPYIYTGEKRFGPPGYPVALASIFGWVITGRVGQERTQVRTALIVTPSQDAILRKFWELEEVPSISKMHPDDIIAEKIFSEKHYRLPNGRYVVPLLLRENAPTLGESRGLAMNRLTGIERKLNKDPELKTGPNFWKRTNR